MFGEQVIRPERAEGLINPLSYDADSKLFWLSDGAFGFGFVCRPLPGADDKVLDRLNVALNNNWPAETLIQFSLFASPNIQSDLSAIRMLRRGQDDALLRETINERCNFFEGGTVRPLDARTGVYVRDMLLIVTVTIPISGTYPSDGEFKTCSELRLVTRQGLETTGFRPLDVSSQGYVSLMNVLLNHGSKAEWRASGPPEVAVDRVLRSQVFERGTDVRVDKDGLWLGDTRVRVMSIKRTPSAVQFGHAARYIGDLSQGMRGLREPTLITGTLYFSDVASARGKLETGRQFVTNQAYGPLLKFVPKLGLKKKDFDDVLAALDEGDRPVKLNLTVVLFSASAEASAAAVANAQSYWGELGFQLLPDQFFCLPLFLNALPFGADRKAIRETMRYKTMSSRAAISLLPLFSDWRGTGTPALNFISRNGQLMSVSLFDSGSNYNCCIAAQSGSGKSFLTNEMITSYLSMGGQVWVIDVGRSYLKLCEVYNGDFIHFGPESRICLNPFDLVQDYEEEADALVGLVTAMAAPTKPLDDYQVANLREAMRVLWTEHANGLMVDHIAEHLMKDVDQRVRDIGEQLYSFTSNGEYGKYFNGKNNVKFDNRFTVLELEELKGRKHLQTVVLLQLIYQIQQEMYLGERDRPKVVVIDEAWDLLTHGDVAKFVEHGYRRFRKYGGAAVTITQGVNDLYASPTGRAIAENSANMYLLGQKAEAINQLKRDGKLPLSEGGYDILKTVHTVAGVYSEIFFLTDYGAGIGRLIVDDFRKLLYSTKAEDVTAIKKRTERGLTVAQAINEILAERQRRFDPDARVA